MSLTWIDPRLRKNVDWLLFGGALALLAVGLGTLWSATASDTHGMQMVLKQAGLVGIGLALMLLLASRDYAGASRYAPLLYGGSLALLLVVAIFFRHEETKGAARWIPLPMGFKLQPSEFGKVAIILTLADYLRRLGPRIRELPSLLRTLAHVGLPMAVVAAQPDLTTALVFGAIWLVMTFLAGADLRHLAAILAIGASIFGLAWHFHIFIKDYQIQRVEVVINSLLGNEVNGQKEGYQIQQAQLAIGGGQVAGQGIGQGIQTRGGWVPENHTDFIFTVIAEETGFLGSCFLLSLYGLVLWRGFLAVAESEDAMGRLVAGGVVTLLTFHIVVNVGMNCGLLPVAGVPLPLVSQGGSAAWTNLAAIGILQSVVMRRRKLQF